MDDQEQYLKKRMQKALKIVDELNYMIEHTLGVNQKEKLDNFPIGDALPVLELPEDFNESFQGPKLYKVMKDFLDIPLATKGGDYPEEVINKYLEDMDFFSFHPKYSGDVFEFTIETYVYKVEIVMDSVISMTLLVKDEWVQTRVIKNPNDFAALMRIMDNMKGVYEFNPYIEEKDFIIFYNKLVKLGDIYAEGWRDVEKKVFVPYSIQNDIYFSVYNLKEFMSDFILEIEEMKGSVASIRDPEERTSVEQVMKFILSLHDESIADDKLKMQSLLKSIDLKNLTKTKAFNSTLFQDLLKKMSKKHNVINRLKELADELKTFSDLKSVEDHCKEAEVYSYESVKQYLIDNNSKMFLENAVLMTQIDSVNLVKYIELREDSFISDRPDIFIELTIRYVLPLNLDQHKRILTILSADPMSYVRKFSPGLEEIFLNIEGFKVQEPDPQAINKGISAFARVEQLEEKFKEESSELFKQISKDVFDEMDELERQGEVIRPVSLEEDEIPEYLQVAITKAIERLAESGFMDKVIAEVKDND